jgi:hypothetical protein
VLLLCLLLPLWVSAVDPGLTGMPIATGLCCLSCAAGAATELLLLGMGQGLSPVMLAGSKLAKGVHLDAICKYMSKDHNLLSNLRNDVLQVTTECGLQCNCYFAPYQWRQPPLQL